MDLVENRTFEEIRVGESASLTHTLSREDLQLVVGIFGDVEPAHVDSWGAAMISTVLATKLPGTGSICKAAAAEMDAASLPFCGRERSQECEHLAASAA